MNLFNTTKRNAIFFTMLLGFTTLALAEGKLEKYADPAEPALPQTTVEISLSDTALVITDPQIDFLHPEGVTWGVVGESVTELGSESTWQGVVIESALAAACRRETQRRQCKQYERQEIS